MRFETMHQAIFALADNATHDEAAKVLLAHADKFDFEASWAWARPMMFAIVAHYRDTLDYGDPSTGPEVYEALRRIENFVIRQFVTVGPNPWTVEWNPDIDAAACFEARRHVDSGK